MSEVKLPPVRGMIWMVNAGSGARMRRARLGIAALLVIVLAAPFGARGADAAGWIATAVDGTAVYLLDQRWQEVVRGQYLAAPNSALRTLRGGELVLEREGAKLGLSSESAVQISLKSDGDATAVFQYAGVVAIDTVGARARVTVQAGTLLVTNINGSISISLADGATGVSLRSGKASVKVADRGFISIEAGEYVVDLSGSLIVKSTGASEAVTASAVAGAKINAHNNAAAPNGAGAPGNPGGSSRSSSGGESNVGGNGNAGGNGNGNAGGNGNGNNAGGSGNGNAGGNGNGNAGGADNGNGNAGGNSNAGGSDKANGAAAAP